jgi:hypothetical protein
MHYYILLFLIQHIRVIGIKSIKTAANRKVVLVRLRLLWDLNIHFESWMSLLLYTSMRFHCFHKNRKTSFSLPFLPLPISLLFLFCEKLFFVFQYFLSIPCFAARFYFIFIFSLCAIPLCDTNLILCIIPFFAEKNLLQNSILYETHIV